MAVTVKRVHHPYVFTRGTGDGSSALALATHLSVTVDPDDDGQRLFTVQLKESDYTGLIAEFEDRSATTILNTSLDTELSAEDMDATDELSSTQRTNVIGHELTLP